jgi:hypothetical protein
MIGIVKHLLRQTRAKGGTWANFLAVGIPNCEPGYGFFGLPQRVTRRRMGVAGRFFATA